MNSIKCSTTFLWDQSPYGRMDHEHRWPYTVHCIPTLLFFFRTIPIYMCAHYIRTSATQVKLAYVARTLLKVSLAINRLLLVLFAEMY